jgi:hypothetical protein
VANLFFGLFLFMLGAILVEASRSSIGPEQFLEMAGAAAAFGTSVLCLALAVRTAVAAVRWRRHRARWRHEARRTAYR